LGTSTSFYQAAVTLLGTLLISGTITEARFHGRRKSGLRVFAFFCFLLAISSFCVGESLALLVLLGEPPTRTQSAWVEFSLACCTISVAMLVLVGFSTTADSPPQSETNDPSVVRDASRLHDTTSVPVLILLTAIVVGCCVAAAWLVHGQTSGNYGLATTETCPGPFTGANFYGEVGPEGTQVFSQPTTRVKALRRYEYRCRLGFVGLCFGEPRSTSKELPNMLWLMTADKEGLVPAAQIAFHVADKAKIRRCSNEWSAPSQLHIYGASSLAFPSTTVHIVADNAAFVGVAEGELTAEHFVWHRVALDLRPEYNEPEHLYLGYPTTARVAIVADACFAASFPSGEFTQYDAQLSQSVLNDGIREACAPQSASE
jgi:uncharacterized membrane protein YhaH (DUF805 family)